MYQLIYLDAASVLIKFMIYGGTAALKYNSREGYIEQHSCTVISQYKRRLLTSLIACRRVGPQTKGNQDSGLNTFN